MSSSVKKRRKISGRLIINIFVIVFSICLVGYFFLSENGLMDLLRSSQTISLFWISMAVFAQLFNLLMDTFVTYNFVHLRYKHFSLWDAVKVCLVGQFFSAITPSSTGGQPMQVYLMTKMGINAGYGTSTMMQKFIVYQLTSTAYSILAIALRFDFFIENLDTPGMWIFVLIGFASQLIVTFALIVICFNRYLSTKFVNFLAKLFKKFKYKKADQKIASLERQINMFHQSNKELLKESRLMVSSFLLVILQLTAILSVPYFIYRAFGLSEASPVDMICCQAFVNVASSLMPLPGASGAAELGFSAFFGVFFTAETIKSAILVWRIITYYGTILLSLPFSYFTKDKKEHEKDLEERMIQEQDETLNRKEQDS